MKTTILCSILGCVLMFPLSLMASRPLVESTFTQIINDVNVLAAADKSKHAAKVTEVFKTPDLLRTGRDSLAEMVAPDKTLTRVGANTAFSFDSSGRNINLEEGSVLFHSPSGKGGGSIKTKAASASVLGTTIVVVTTANGGFKTIVLEGKGMVRLANGNFRVLKAGQLVFVLPGAQNFGPVLDINLDKLVKTARLVNGFENKLPSIAKIEVAVAKQAQLIQSGGAEDTGLLVGNSATQNNVQVVDSSIIEQAVGTDSSIQQAFNTDVTISSSTLDSAHLFLQPFTMNLADVDQTVFRGFIGHNITLSTPSLDLSPYTSPSDYPEFDILASGNLDITGSVSFSGSASGTYRFVLGALGTINIPPGSLLMVQNLGAFELDSSSPLSFNTVDFHNLTDGVHFGGGSSSGVSLVNCGVAGHWIDLDTDGPINVNNTFLDASSDPASYVNMYSQGNITVTGSSIFGGGPSSTILWEAQGMLTVNSTTFNNIGSISLAAQTLVLQNVDFPNGSTVTLFSANGTLAPNPNTGQAIQPGYVNFINNVTYNGTPAQNVIGSSITLATF